MTTGISSTNGSALPLQMALALGVDQLSLPLASAGSGSEDAIIYESPDSSLPLAGLGFRSVDDLGLEIQLLQARSSIAQTDNEKLKANASKESQIESIKQRLEEIAKAAQERAKAEKNGFWSKLFKWVAAVVAAVAGALSSAFSGGAGAAVAAVVIAVIFSAESVVKAVTDALVECGSMSAKGASILRACLGCLEDIVTQLAEAGAFGENGEKVAAVLNLIIGAAKAIVSCVVGGIEGVGEIVGAVLSLTAEAVKVAQEVVVMVYEQLDKMDELNQGMMLALQIVSFGLQAGAMVSSLTGDGARDSAGNAASETSTPTQRQVQRAVQLALDPTKAGADMAAAGFDARVKVNQADAAEADSKAELEAAIKDAMIEAIKQAGAALESIFADLDDVLGDVESMMALEQQRFTEIFSLARA